MRTDALLQRRLPPPVPTARDLLHHWFGSETDDARVADAQSALWWGREPQTDAELRARFGALVVAAAAGELAAWSLTPRGRLALILLLDQLPRAICRGSAQAFAGDPQARRLTLQALQVGADRGLRPIERVFLLMPLAHAESMSCQSLSVARFQALADEVREPWRPTFSGFVAWAERHRDLIARFGRFPQRNAILGRESTPDELRFLEGAGSPRWPTPART